MIKKVTIFFLLFLTLPTFSSAAIDQYCNNKINQSDLNNLDNLKIKNINVKTNNYRKWTRNSLRILIGNFRWIPKKYKRLKLNLINS